MKERSKEKQNKKNKMIKSDIPCSDNHIKIKGVMTSLEVQKAC